MVSDEQLKKNKYRRKKVMLKRVQIGRAHV